MKIFISYSTLEDQIIALRLQTLAAVYGITTYVPPASTRQLDWEGGLEPEVLQHLKTSDVVLAVITQIPTLSATNEMNSAIQHKKILIPIVSEAVPPEQYGNLPRFTVNPFDPTETERQIVAYLNEKKQKDAAKLALLALSTLAVALLIFGSKSD